MKSLTPTSISALATLARAGAVSADYTFPYAKPTFRFEPFHKLDITSRNIAEEKLGYIEITWNNHGLAPIENKGWSVLTKDERNAATVLGFTQGAWDCFINHYKQYTWDELAENGVQQAYRGLGWTQAHWEKTTDEVPYTEARWWDMLTDNEKKSANVLCYFEDNWDEKDMNPNPTAFPHPMPMFRYKPWNELDYVTQNVASEKLNYTEFSWNNLGLAVVEKNTLLNLDSEQREAALELGFYTHTWDCFMNHYQSYFWSSFHEDLRVAIETLGWTEAMWSEESDLVPASEDKMWVDLTPEEKAAATRLCFFKETWDGEPVTKWNDDEIDGNTAIILDETSLKDDDLNTFVEPATGKLRKMFNPLLYLTEFVLLIMACIMAISPLVIIALGDY